MAIFIALYSGPSVGEAQLIAVSVDRDLVAQVSARLLKETGHKDSDPVVAKLEQGRRQALRLKDFKHGPFFYHVWYAQGIRYKSYVKKVEFDRIKAGIEAYQAQKREQQQERAEIKTILRENRETRRNLYAILRGFKI